MNSDVKVSARHSIPPSRIHFDRIKSEPLILSSVSHLFLFTVIATDLLPSYQGAAIEICCRLFARGRIGTKCNISQTFLVFH
jgi:hypothetical protein